MVHLCLVRKCFANLFTSLSLDRRMELVESKASLLKYEIKEMHHKLLDTF